VTELRDEILSTWQDAEHLWAEIEPGSTDHQALTRAIADLRAAMLAESGSLSAEVYASIRAKLAHNRRIIDEIRARLSGPG
jgi:head-tail adaptor